MANSRRELLDLLHTANRARMLADSAAWRARQQAAERASRPLTDPADIAERDAALRAILGRA
jgi:hypothetical protein